MFEIFNGKIHSKWANKPTANVHIEGECSKPFDDPNGVEELEKRVDSLNEDKVNLPKLDGVINYGTAGQFAVSDGAGGIAWKTLNQAEEVSF